MWHKQDVVSQKLFQVSKQTEMTHYKPKKKNPFNSVLQDSKLY